MSSGKEIQEFFNRYEEKRERWRKRDREEAPDFNVFETLRVERNETIHCRMLGDLPNPDGSHGQGLRFLASFLCYCRKNIHGFPRLLDGDFDKSARVRIIREFGSAWGRPDLAIYSESLRFALIIEIKIDADDQEGQIPRYLESLHHDFSFAPRERRALVYLSLSGDRAKKAGQACAGQDYFCMSHGKHVAEWLDSCSSEKLPIRVRGLLLQYVDTLRNLTEKRPTEEPESDEIIKE
jgi:hypothetical protein